ncbi:hypothetical protein DW1_1206 [Proteiniborus sp. DW1]|uniref:DUF975 family protein n=1 Tax=Proteiniborus sp. DW1 TaxID=1889883 RepID=UPI00092E1BB1|nr:DUF975 family protein [Proteiniborus sp. DW1]SCG82779.1 hypothetical protein DW1_1206 [Proteiniborus sp. DW1]
MWTRAELKQRAKNVLRFNYWKAFLISLAISFASGSGGGGGGRSSRSALDFPRTSDTGTIIVIVVIFLLIMLFFLALRILIGYPLEVGGQRYFVKSAEDKDNKKCFSFAFEGHNYSGIVPTMLLRGVFTFLWTLLLVIPGIIKSYSYSMVPYILGDNPNIGAKRAIELSNEMTYGYKFDMFVLKLSFIGWYLLGLLALGIGTLFVLPYDNAAHAELYLVLRQRALEHNMCTYEELLLDKPDGDGYDGPYY